MAPEGGRWTLSWCLNSAISFQNGGGCFTDGADKAIAGAVWGCWAKDGTAISKAKQQVRIKVGRKQVSFITTFCQIYDEKSTSPRLGHFRISTYLSWIFEDIRA